MAIGLKTYLVYNGMTDCPASVHYRYIYKANERVPYPINALQLLSDIPLNT